MVIPAREGALGVWKLLSKSVASRSIGREGGTDLPIVKGTALIMAEDQ